MSRLRGNQKTYAQEHKRMRIQVERLRILSNVDVASKGRKRRKDAASVKKVTTNITKSMYPEEKNNACGMETTHAGNN